MRTATLDNVLAKFAGSGSRLRADAAAAVRSLADAAAAVRERIALGPLGGAFAQQTATHADGDVQKALDVAADEAFLAAARTAPIAYYASEERDGAITLDPAAPLALAIDPLDGSSNIDANAPMGTIFALVPARESSPENPNTCFLQQGKRQLAAGFFLYGPQLTLMLTLGEGVKCFVYAPDKNAFICIDEAVSVPTNAREFAINASNWRHWDDGVRLYVEDCLAGVEGPRGRDFNMRWLAAVAGEAQRILSRGGVFLYPGDARAGYGRGRLRLVYEAHPIAFLMEQAGGAATDGTTRILELAADTLHARTPLVFGAADEVARIARYLTEPSAIAERSPLFGRRGLFRA